MNERGQADAVFRLMIDSVIGLAILLIIISAVSYFQGQVIEQSRADLMNLIQYSANSPDGQVITSKDLTFKEGYAIDSLDVQNWAGINEKCFSFQSKYSSIKITNDSKRAEFTQLLTTKVYAQCTPVLTTCNPKDPEGDCCFACIISFGKQAN